MSIVWFTMHPARSQPSIAPRVSKLDIAFSREAFGDGLYANEYLSGLKMHLTTVGSECSLAIVLGGLPILLGRIPPPVQLMEPSVSERHCATCLIPR